jgi:class 3 adenylate cyclase/tetratricopeptide (TPR) repeat protein
MVCPNCGQDNAPKFAFCPRCGARLSSAHARVEALGERKLVTVLFADVVGFTPLSERYDAEEVASIVNRVLSTLSAEIVRYEGAVDRYAGDALVARFGAPIAQENHAELGMRAALAMQAALARLNGEFERDRGVTLQLRIGVNTGEVIAAPVGGAGVRRYTVMGDAVNAAARCEQACRPGAVLAGEGAWRRTQALFEFDGPQRLPGDSALNAYYVVREKPERQGERGLPGLTAPLIGRARELAALQAAYSRVAARQALHVVAITGEPGIGKTRLRAEFIAWLNLAHPEAQVLIARCFAHTAATPYALAAGLVRSALGVAPDAPAENLWAGLFSGEDLRGNEERAFELYSLAALLGLEDAPAEAGPDPLAGLDPPQRQARLFLSVSRVLARLGARPLVLVAEDMQWADAASRALLDHLVSDLAGVPVLLLVLARPGAFDNAGGALAARLRDGSFETLVLHELNPADSATLIAELLRRMGIGAGLAERIVSQAQGNPFFVEELIRSLIEDGTLVRRGNTWQATRPVESLRVPETVQEVLAARIDHLPAEEKLVLTRAAVLGRTFWQPPVAHLTDAPVEHALHGLIAKGLIQSLAPLEDARAGRSSQPGGEAGHFTFRHVLVQEVAYGLLPRQARQLLHRRAAEWFEREAQAGGHVEESLDLLAYHFAQSDDHARACLYLERAAARAARAYANDAALHNLEQLIARLGPGGPSPRLAAALDLRLELLGRVADEAGFARDVAALLACAQALGDAAHLAHAHLRRAELLARRRDPQSEAAAEETVRLARAAGERALEARGLKQIGAGRFMNGNLRGALAPLEAALVIQVAIADEREESATRHLLGYLYTGVGEYDLAREHLDRALAVQRARGYRSGEGFSLSNLGVLEMTIGNHAQAERCLTAAAEVRARTGERRGQAVALLNLVQIYLEQEDWARARETAGQARALTRAAGGSRMLEAMLDVALAACALGEGRPSEALASCAQAAEGPPGAVHVERLVVATHAHLALGDTAAALTDSAEAVQAWQAGEADESRPQAVWLARYRALLAAGDPAAGAALQQAQALVEAQAARIRDAEQRQVFLAAVPVNREIAMLARTPGSQSLSSNDG